MARQGAGAFLPHNRQDAILGYVMQTRICQGKPSREENMGTIAEEEAELLRGLVISLRPKCIAEIGTGWTRSLRAMRDGVKYLKDTLDWDCEIWTCDVAEAAVTRGKEIGGPITVVHGTVDDLVSQMPVPDLVFIDGSHEREDVAHDHQTMRGFAPNAVCVFHDARDEYCGVFEYLKDIQGVILPTPRGIGIVR